MTRFVGGSIIYPQETIVLQGDVQGSEVTDGGGGRKFREQRRRILQHRARIRKQTTALTAPYIGGSKTETETAEN